MKIVGLDVGSTTVKAAVVRRRHGHVWQDYQRHNTRQAEKVLEFLDAHGGRGRPRRPARDRVFSPARAPAPSRRSIGGKYVQEVVAVAACVERLHPEVRFVSEIGGEDMKTIFFTAAGDREVEAGLHAVGVQRRDRHLHREDRAQAAGARRAAGRHAGYDGLSLHKVSSKCGIFAETDANTLVKTGVPVEEIIASLFEAVVYQNLAHADQGQHADAHGAAARRAESLLQGAPGGVAPSPRRSSGRSGKPRRRAARSGRAHPRAGGRPLLRLPRLRRDRPGRERRRSASTGTRQARVVGRAGASRSRRRRTAPRVWSRAADELATFVGRYVDARHRRDLRPREAALRGPVLLGCDFGSTTAKAVVLSLEKELLFSCYAISKGNPIEDAQSLFRQVRRQASPTSARSR